MKLAIVLTALVLSVQVSAQIVDTTAGVAEEPAYQVLFESGLYQQAVEYITNRLAGGADSAETQLSVYLAFSQIMLGNISVADSIFAAILSRDSLFALDPIMTSPKMYEVYAGARKAWEERLIDVALAEPDTAKTAERMLEQVVPGPAIPGVAGHRRLNPTKRLACFLPLGCGQFVNKRPVRGVLIGALQVVALGTSIALYQFREEIRDPRYGLYDGNADRYKRYTAGYRIGFALAITGWTTGVIESSVTFGRDQNTD